jgi:transcriptional regulator with XRE-family HTH domain
MGAEDRSTILGNRLTRLRQRTGLSMYQLAQRTGLNRSTLMRIEDGTYAQPSVETLNALARELNVEPEELYDAVWQDSDEPLPSPSVYLRNKYDLSDQQVAELESTIKRIAGEADDT